MPKHAFYIFLTGPSQLLRTIGSQKRFQLFHIFYFDVVFLPLYKKANTFVSGKYLILLQYNLSIF